MNNVKIFYSNFWTSGDLVGTSALHVQLVRRTSQHWIVIWTLYIIILLVIILWLANITFFVVQCEYSVSVIIQ